MGNSLAGETTRLIACGGTEAARFFKLSLFVALAAYSLPREDRHA